MSSSRIEGLILATVLRNGPVAFFLLSDICDEFADSQDDASELAREAIRALTHDGHITTNRDGDYISARLGGR